jgi:hypothetical protein
MTDDFVPDLMDIPISMVNACLYQHIEGISDDEEEDDEDDPEGDGLDYDAHDDDNGSFFDEAILSDWGGSADM